jgi:phosphatidylserine/phosphatidylglycerophosphate/cardiolipin synthase-like enzyme
MSAAMRARFFSAASLAALLVAGALGAASCSDATVDRPGGGNPGDPTADGGGGTNDGAAPGSDGGGDPGGPTGPTQAVRILVEPSDKGAALVAAINGAKTSVHVTMYILTSNAVIDALVAQKKAGKDVRVLLNKTFPPPQGNSNFPAFGTLKNAGIDVRYAAATFTYTHEKCVILDGTEAWIMTMNTVDSSTTDNREYLAIDDDKDDVSEAEAIFAADMDGKAITPAGKLVVAPTNAKDRLIALVNAATKTLDIEGETFSDDQLAAAVIARAAAGVKVRIVLSDETPTAAQSQSVSQFKAAKIPIVSRATPSIHAKTIVVDGALAYVGSENFTYNSMVNNRELGLITSATTEIAKITATITTDFTGATPL